uniref:G_PROTEIN_RECEP_F1_2 domain-containing protein n=1 Tax=Steinernema glaseri TaxID=37863 RepID=A0A1I7YFZ2_9BILA
MTSTEFYMIVYSIIGCIVVAVNIPICCLIYFSKALKPSKELILIGGLCLADAVQAMANILSGFQRIILYSRGLENGRENSLRCFVEPFNVLFFFGYHLVGIMTMLVSVDRLVAVLKPTRHEMIFSRRNGILLTIATFSFSALTFVICLFFQIKYTKEMSILCFGSEAYLPYVWEWVHQIRLVPVLVSIALYLPISFKLYKIMKSNTVGRQLYQNRKLISFTKTVGFVSFSALILLVIPDILVTYFKPLVGDYEKAMFILAHSKAIINIFIFTFRHSGLRRTCAFAAKRFCGFVTRNRINLVTVSNIQSMRSVDTH